MVTKKLNVDAACCQSSYQWSCTIISQYRSFSFPTYQDFVLKTLYDFYFFPPSVMLLFWLCPITPLDSRSSGVIRLHLIYLYTVHCHFVQPCFSCHCAGYFLPRTAAGSLCRSLCLRTWKEFLRLKSRGLQTAQRISSSCRKKNKKQTCQTIP